VLIGAGPTGVEMSGALSELARFALVHEYRHIDTLKTRIVLLRRRRASCRLSPRLSPANLKRNLNGKGSKYGLTLPRPQSTRRA
jgi:NADH dehydrogenase FAD-containing subunit